MNPTKLPTYRMRRQTRLRSVRAAEIGGAGGIASTLCTWKRAGTQGRWRAAIAWRPRRSERRPCCRTANNTVRSVQPTPRDRGVVRQVLADRIAGTKTKLDHLRGAKRSRPFRPGSVAHRRTRASIEGYDLRRHCRRARRNRQTQLLVTLIAIEASSSGRYRSLGSAWTSRCFGF